MALPLSPEVTNSQHRNALRVLIPFNTVSLYGMERAVIEMFYLLGPQVEPHFLLSRTTLQLSLPVLREIQNRGMKYSFFSDERGWPKIAKPRSLNHAWKMSKAMVRGNCDVFKAARDKDLIYIPSVNYFFFAVMAAVTHRLLRRRRLVYHFHDLILKRSKALQLLTAFVTDFVHNTQLGENSVQNLNPCIKRKRNWVIPLTIQSRVQPAKNGNETMTSGIGPSIIYVGQVSHRKGVDLLLDAYTLLKRAHRGLTLNIVGGCEEADLTARMNSENNSGGIKYWGYRDDVLQMVKMADVYVQPSPPSRFNESFGRGVVEAMSMGTPAVCFRSGALQEIIVDQQTSLICEEETAECMAGKVSRLLNDRDLRERYSTAGLARFKSHYGEARVKALWLQLLKSQ